MGTFSVDISKFIEKTNKNADLIMRKIAIDLTEKVRIKTPVDSGALRKSWTSSIGKEPSSFNGDKSANNLVTINDTWYLATDKLYAPLLEYGLYPQPGGNKTIDGYSTQAPQGMVRISVQETLDWLKKVKF